MEGNGLGGMSGGPDSETLHCLTLAVIGAGAPLVSHPENYLDCPDFHYLADFIELGGADISTRTILPRMTSDSDTFFFLLFCFF